jgi:hypothetical protein
VRHDEGRRREGDRSVSLARLYGGRRSDTRGHSIPHQKLGLGFWVHDVITATASASDAPAVTSSAANTVQRTAVECFYVKLYP